MRGQWLCTQMPPIALPGICGATASTARTPTAIALPEAWYTRSAAATSVIPAPMATKMRAIISCWNAREWSGAHEVTDRMVMRLAISTASVAHPHACRTEVGHISVNHRARERIPGAWWLAASSLAVGCAHVR